MANPARKIAVVGLGYVGLPLATAFGRQNATVGYDIDRARIEELREGIDRNRDVPADKIRYPLLEFTADPEALCQTDFMIVAVPTPVDASKVPDLSYLERASETVGRALRNRPVGSVPAVVTYESTVYPGCTEEICVPILERESGLQAGREFTVGYSPERVNPGDPDHGLDKVIKIVASNDPKTLELMVEVYGTVATTGVYPVPNIQVAEAAKVIENVQRDQNIALMNELSILFHRLGLDGNAVLSAARTKWNFLPFEPGLVGGHCIPVDAYYLAHRAAQAGYHPEMILAGRRINDRMGHFVAEELVKLLVRAGTLLNDCNILVLGATFKEDVADLRNTRVVDIVQTLDSYGARVNVYDPLVQAASLEATGLRPCSDPFADGSSDRTYDAVVLAVPHRTFRDQPFERYLKLLKAGGSGTFIDVRGVFRAAARERPKLVYWTL